MKAGLPLKTLAVVVVLVAGAGAWVWQKASRNAEGGATGGEVRVPDLSPLAIRGKVEFDSVCAGCHGSSATGTDKGPPLVHDIYNPGHHGDEAFYRAVKLGSRQHHWPFGDMPPQPQVSEDQIGAIVRYVRELQLANGIRRHPHRM